MEHKTAFCRSKIGRRVAADLKAAGYEDFQSLTDVTNTGVVMREGLAVGGECVIETQNRSQITQITQNQKKN